MSNKASQESPSPPPKFADLPDLVTPDDVSAFLQVSRNTTYELIKTKALRSVRFGRLIRIPKDALLGESK
jgi:excisionase family DNA binding protein